MRMRAAGFFLVRTLQQFEFEFGRACEFVRLPIGVLNRQRTKESTRGR
jgi:hypothetical protein